MGSGARLIGLVGLACSSCGAGTAAIATASGGSGPSNSPTQIAEQGLSVAHAKVSPLRLSFELIDPESDRVSAQLEFLAPGETEFRAMRLVEGADSLTSLETDGDGFSHVRNWDFAGQLGSGVIGTCQLRLRLSGSGRTAAREVFVGNDLPELIPDSIQLDPVTREASGNVAFGLRLADATPGVARVQAQYLQPGRSPDDPDSWRIARADGVPSSAPPDEYFATGLQLDASETALTFVWDSIGDLRQASVPMRLRFRVEEEFAPGEFLAGDFVETPDFALDNNDSPVGILNNERWTLDSDARRVVPVPFQLLDPEGDPVRAVLQWRRPEGAFPELPGSAAEIGLILADPAQRRAFHVCTEAPLAFEGTLAAPLAADPRQVRLVDLAASRSSLLASRSGVHELELLRRPGLAPARNWQHTLDRPVAVVPLPDGTQALALDRQGTGWRLVRVDLARGQPLPEGAPIVRLGDGTPTALALSPSGRRAFVAESTGADWTLTTFTSDTLEPVATRTGQGADVDGVRALLALDDERALVTVADRLLWVEVGGPAAPRVLASGLAGPWGLARDEESRELVYLAERDHDRVLAFDLARSALLPLSLGGGSEPPLIRPRALAVARADLHVVSEPSPGVGEVRVLPLRRLRAEPAARPSRVVAAQGAPRGATGVAPGSTIAVGPEGLRILSDPAAPRPLLAGGVEQRRPIALQANGAIAYDSATQSLSLAEPLDPEPEAGTPWRILRAPDEYPSDPAVLRSSRFSWDTRDVLGGDALLRLTPVDGDPGVRSEGLVAKRIRSPFDLMPVHISDPVLLSGSAGLALWDLDGDGDLDVASANEFDSSFTFYTQGPGRSWDHSFTRTEGIFLHGPTAMAFGDLDQNGLYDFAAVIPDDDGYEFFVQTAALEFDVIGPCPGGKGGVEACGSEPRDILAADLDGDGDLDLVTAENTRDSVAILRNTPPQTSGQRPTFAFEYYPSVPDLRGVVCLDVGDLDRDGDLDLVAGSFDDNNLTVLRQGPSGTFGIERVPGFVPTPSAVLIEDLDADGLPDIVCTNSVASDLTYFHAGPAGFTPIPLGAPGGAVPSAVVALDCDGDADLDLAFTRGDRIGLFAQLAPGLFAEAPHSIPLAGAVNLTDLVTADVDGDGDGDLVVADGSAARLSILYQGDPAPEQPDLVAGPALTGASNPARGLTLGDLDGDGNLDLVSPDSNVGGGIDVWVQAGSEVYQRLADDSLTGLDLPRATELADLDADGRLDLVSANRGTNQTVIHRQEGSAALSFADPTLFGEAGTTGLVGALALADYDDDGRIDIVAASESTQTLALFPQAADGSFATPSWTLPLPLAPSQLLVADLDRDGRLDLVTNQGSERVLVLFGAPGGEFLPNPRGELVGAYTRFTAGDLDDDGLLEILTAGSGQCLGFAQGVRGSFDTTPVLQLVADGGVSSIATADLEGDGRTDLVVLGHNSLLPSLRIYSGLGSSRFEGGAPLALGSLGLVGGVPTALRVADLDGDQDPDLVFSVRTGVRILFGRH